MKTKRKWLSVVLLSVFILFFAACSNSGQSTSSDNGDKSNKSSDGVVELTYWGPLSGPDGPIMKKIVEDFNKSQDQYKVNFQIIPQTEYYKTVDLAFNGEKSIPEFMIMHGDQIATYARKGTLKELDSIMGDKLSKDEYHPKGWEAATVDDKLYAVPLDIQPLMLYWNKDLFKEVGLDPDSPPTTREEFLDYAQKLTKKDKNQYGFVVPTLWPQQFIFPTIVAQNGGEFLNNGKIDFTSDAVVNALQFEKDLINKYKVSPSDVQQDGEVTMFIQGKNAMHLNGPWMLKQWQDAGINFGVAPVPQLGTEQQAVYANSHNFVIPKDVSDEKVAGVVAFIKYIQQNGIAWAESGQAPASKAVYESEEFKKMDQQPQVAKQFDTATVSPDVENWGQITSPLWEAVNKVLLGQSDVTDALKEAEQKANQKYKE